MSVQTVVIQAIIVTVWDAVLCGSIALSGGSSSSVGYLTAIGLTVVIYLVEMCIRDRDRIAHPPVGSARTGGRIPFSVLGAKLDEKRDAREYHA